MDEKRMRPDHWLELVLCDPLGVLTLMELQWKEGHPTRENHVH